MCQLVMVTSVNVYDVCKGVNVLLHADAQPVAGTSRTLNANFVKQGEDV